MSALDNYQEKMLMENHMQVLQLKADVGTAQKEIEKTLENIKELNVQMRDTQKAASKLFEGIKVLNVEIQHMKKDVSEKRTVCQRRFSVIGKALTSHGEVVGEIETGKKAARLAWGLIACLLLSLSSGALWVAKQALDDIRGVQSAAHDLRVEQGVLNTKIGHLEARP